MSEANKAPCSVQVNIPAESGEMGVLASHVPSIEQLKPGLVEVIEESGGSKQFFCTLNLVHTHHTPDLEGLSIAFGGAGEESIWLM